MRFAFADSPYLGQGKKHYGSYHPEAATWDDPETHRRLIERLVGDFPDGWVMCLSVPSLRILLPMAPPETRVCAWVKPFHVFKKGVRPAYAWEPVLLYGGRNEKPPAPLKGGEAITPRDWGLEQALMANITLRKGLPGAKPPEFNDWVLDLLNIQLGDELVDLFPGTGGMLDRWEMRQGLQLTQHAQGTLL